MDNVEISKEWGTVKTVLEIMVGVLENIILLLHLKNEIRVFLHVDRVFRNEAQVMEGNP